MRDKYGMQLEFLNTELISMGALCETAIATAVKAMITGNKELAKETSEAEKAIDEKENQIEELCVKLILKQQPVAHDLMFISAALKMITDMERIGDQAYDISELVTDLPTEFLSVNSDIGISNMSQVVIRMVTESVDSFVDRNVELAKSVIDSDNIVDKLFEKIKIDLSYEVKKDKLTVDEALNTLMIAKYLERIGDHAVNIAEWVDFAVTGKHNLK